MEAKTTYLLKVALGLSLFTIFYNIGEGLVCTFLGYNDESLTLFGFGTDSFIEALSGFGILHMVSRIRAHPNSNRDQYERKALRITGVSFYILVFGLIVSGVYSISTGRQPTDTFWGVVISVISILIMIALYIWKVKVGKSLNSDAIIADAECTKVCIYMSLVLLASSALFHFANIRYIDSIGALVLAYFSFKEGRECFYKARTDKYCMCHEDETGAKPE